MKLSVLNEIRAIPMLDGMLAFWRTGSSYTVDPPVEDTDVDVLVLVKSLHLADELIEKHGYEQCLTEEAAQYRVETGFGDSWTAVRKGKVNLIIVEDLTLYARYVAATELAKTMNIKDKEERIKLFKLVKWGEWSFSYTGEDGEKVYCDDYVIPGLLEKSAK
jgi:hypothetical protein